MAQEQEEPMKNMQHHHDLSLHGHGILQINF